MIESNILNLITNIVTMLREHWIHVHLIHNKSHVGYGVHPLSPFWYRSSASGPRLRTLCPFPTRPEHIAYLSNFKDGHVAYMPNKWHTGKHQTMKIGKYLAKYSDLDNEAIKKIVSQCQRFTVEYRSDIVEAYLESAEDTSACESCMSKTPTYYYSKRHPMEVMESGPFKVALLRNPLGKIVSRALICTSTKTFPMVYGHHELVARLEQDGYHHGDFHGVSVDVREDDRGNITLPYVDGERVLGDRSIYKAMRFDYDGDGVVTFNRNGDYVADSTDGWVAIEETMRCEDCGDSMHEDDAYYVSDHGSVCECCIENYVQAYDRWGHNDELHLRDDCIEAADGEWFTCGEAAARQDYYEVESRGEYYHLDHIVHCDYSDEWHLLDDVQAIVHAYEGTFVVVDGSLDGLGVDCEGDLRISAGEDIQEQASKMSQETFEDFVNDDVSDIISYLEFSDNLELEVV